MKTINHLLVAAALLGSGAPLCHAVEPAAPTSGKVLVLDNERTLEGDIERVGDQYRVRRTLGETWLKADRALRLCADNDDALAFLRSRANLDDADERLRLALWCRERSMRGQMLDEVRAAVRLRPEHVETKRILAHLEQSALVAPRSTPTPTPEQPELPSSPAFEVTAEALGMFASKVQPILMNSCAPCHATGRGGAFKLAPAYDLTNRRATQTNLAAVLAQVNTNQPFASPFLSKAASLHGEMAQAPFKNRQAAAFRSLEDWVRLTVTNSPPSHVAAPPPPVVLPTPATGAFGEERTAGPPPVPPVASQGPAATPAAPPPPAPDAFDPDEFNRANSPLRP